MVGWLYNCLQNFYSVTSLYWVCFLVFLQPRPCYIAEVSQRVTIFLVVGFLFCLFCLGREEHAVANIWCSEDNFQVLVLSFHHVMELKDGTQVIRLGSKHLVSRLTNPWHSMATGVRGPAGIAPFLPSCEVPGSNSGQTWGQVPLLSNHLTGPH